MPIDPNEHKDNPMDFDPLDPVRAEVEALREALETLEARVEEIETDHKSTEEREREQARRLLVAAGFTEAQAGALEAMYAALQRRDDGPLGIGRLTAVRHRPTFDPGEAERAWKAARGVLFEEPTMTRCPPPRGVFQHPDPLETIGPYIMAALPHVLPYVIRLLRPEAPRPWWQQQLRKLVGV